MDTCKICNSPVELRFNAQIFNKKYGADYFYCNNCGYLCTEEPFWLSEAYKSPITINDTGILARNIYFSNLTSTLLFILFDKKSQFLDYGGGYGIFTRLMRDIGFDFFHYDPYCSNLFARGFEFNSEINRISIITCWECFEHFIDPITDIEKMLVITKNILFSTELIPEPFPQPGEWAFYGLEHGQHISFYSNKTLKFLASKYHLNFYSYGNIHLFTEQKLNNNIVRYLVYFSSIGFSSFIKNLIKSKTEEDMMKTIELFNVHENSL